MNNKIVYVVLLLVGLGLGFSIPHGAKNQQQVGGAAANDRSFVYGLHAGLADQFAIDSSGVPTAPAYKTATVGSSSSSPAVLGSAAAGHFVVAAAATTASASTTAVTLNSDISLQLEQSTPIAGTTCNTTVNSSSTIAVATKAAGNGFTVTTAGAPTTNPFCYSYSITN